MNLYWYFQLKHRICLTVSVSYLSFLLHEFFLSSTSTRTDSTSFELYCPFQQPKDKIPKVLEYFLTDKLLFLCIPQNMKQSYTYTLNLKYHFNINKYKIRFILSCSDVKYWHSNFSRNEVKDIEVVWNKFYFTDIKQFWKFTTCTKTSSIYTLKSAILRVGKN